MKPKYIINGVKYNTLVQICRALGVPAPTVKFRLESPNFEGWKFANGVIPRKNTPPRSTRIPTPAASPVTRYQFEQLYMRASVRERLTLDKADYLYLYKGKLYCSLYAVSKVTGYGFPRLRYMFSDPFNNHATMVKNKLKSEAHRTEPICQINGTFYWRHLDACKVEGITYGSLKHRLNSCSYPEYICLGAG